MISSKFGKRVAVKYSLTTALSVTIGLAITAISQSNFGNVTTYLIMIIVLFVMYIIVLIIEQGGELLDKISVMKANSHVRKMEVLRLKYSKS
jgi:nitrogen fixation/metabolism regulation signal transduction histidine kinase